MRRHSGQNTEATAEHCSGRLGVIDFDEIGRALGEAVYEAVLAVGRESVAEKIGAKRGSNNR